MNKTGNLSKVQKMVLMAVLVALTLVMAFTPLGYLKIGALSISFLCIPIAIGAIVLGPSAGLTLGIIFGLTSYFQCFGADAFGTAMMTLNWFYTFVICVVSRALMGWLTGLKHSRLLTRANLLQRLNWLSSAARLLQAARPMVCSTTRQNNSL